MLSPSGEITKINQEREMMLEFDPKPTTDEIKALLDKAFGPVIEKILEDRATLAEYYHSGMNVSRFAVRKQKTWQQINYLFEKYGLPKKIPREKAIPFANAERAEFDGKHYRY